MGRLDHHVLELVFGFSCMLRSISKCHMDAAHSLTFPPAPFASSNLSIASFRTRSLMSGVYDNASRTLPRAVQRTDQWACLSIDTSQKQLGSISRRLMEKYTRLWTSSCVEDALLKILYQAVHRRFRNDFLISETLRFTAEQIFCECHEQTVCESWLKGVHYQR